MKCPFLRRRERGSGVGRAEIVFSQEYGYGDAQTFADRMVTQLGLTVTDRIDGPDAWIWDIQGANGQFVFFYTDFPPETTLWATNPESDISIERLFRELLETASDSNQMR